MSVTWTLEHEITPHDKKRQLYRFACPHGSALWSLRRIVPPQRVEPWHDPRFVARQAAALLRERYGCDCTPEAERSDER
jgi:hypothetical protein